MDRFDPSREYPVKDGMGAGTVVLSEKVVRTYKTGYRVVERVYQDKAYGKKWKAYKHRMKYAVNENGDYIGNPKTAHNLCTKRGIAPEALKGNAVCSVGKGRDGKWYGWSHRAIYGFEPGHVVKEGDIGFDKLGNFHVKTEEDARKVAEAFARDVS
jgi:hypothetical protein